MYPRSRPYHVLFLAMVLGFVLPAQAAGAPEDAAGIPSLDAARHVGETVTICGPVVAASHFDHIRGEPTFLNFDRPHPNQSFTVVIWGENNAKFERPPHRMFAKRTVCVTGRVETYKGKPQIEVRDPDQIRVVSGQFEADRFSYEERVVLKAMLAALGHPLDIGTGEWDDEADRALRAFQEENGLAKEEGRSPAVLNALAAAVPRLSDGDRTRLLQLFLLNLAQREEAAR